MRTSFRCILAGAVLLLGCLARSLPANIYKITPNGVESVFYTNSYETFGLAFDAAGNLYATENSGRISKFTSNGVRSTFYQINGESLTAWDLAFDRTGNLYVTDPSYGKTWKFTLGGVHSVFATVLTGPSDIAFDSQGNLFAGPTWHSTQSIWKITPGGGVSGFASIEQSYSARSLAIDGADNLFVANGSFGIERFTPTGIPSIFAPDPYRSGLVFDTAGNLYTVAGGIDRYTPAGVKSVVIANLGLGSIYDVAIDSAGNIYVAGGPPVPEPSTLALLGLGLPALLGLSRGRRV